VLLEIEQGNTLFGKSNFLPSPCKKFMLKSEYSLSSWCSAYLPTNVPMELTPWHKVFFKQLKFCLRMEPTPWYMSPSIWYSAYQSTYLWNQLHGTCLQAVDDLRTHGTPWCRVFPQELTVIQLVKIFSAILDFIKPLIRLYPKLCKSFL
jgi:hypothetical protein